MVDERIVAMGEDLNLRDTEPTDEAFNENEVSKEQLQHEMDSARESISHTVSAIADTVTHQAQAIRDTVAQKLDWREHARNHPAAVTLGAMGVGFIIGYSLIGSMSKKHERSNGRTDGHALEGAQAMMETAPQRKKEKKSEGPSFFSKLKTTHGYQRLSSGASNLLDQFIDEAVNVGKTVLLPAAINKITDTIRASFEDESQAAGKTDSKQRGTDNRSHATQAEVVG